MPNMARWLYFRSHRIVGWETDLSCQTGGAQAGILHGKNHNIPAFRWVEKANNNGHDSTGRGFAAYRAAHLRRPRALAMSGAARANLFTGNAQDVPMVYSR